MTLNDLQKEHSDYMPVFEHTNLECDELEYRCVRESVISSLSYNNLDDKLTTLTVERKCLFSTIEVLEADVKCQKEEMVQLESKARESQESADRCTAAALLMAAYLRHSTPSLHYPYRPANNGFSLPVPQTTSVLSPTFLSSSALKADLEN
ncbi:hypothetical protein J6590_101326, partial [Homalodisca vitripennis]